MLTIRNQWINRRVYIYWLWLKFIHVKKIHYNENLSLDRNLSIWGNFFTAMKFFTLIIVQFINIEVDFGLAFSVFGDIWPVCLCRSLIIKAGISDQIFLIMPNNIRTFHIDNLAYNLFSSKYKYNFVFQDRKYECID